MSEPSAATQSTVRIFLACPISEHLDRFTSRLRPGYERFIRALHAVLCRAGDVFLALEREQWGQALMSPEVCTPLDYFEMQRCDIVVAYPGLSCGVAVELGWATAMRKPIVLLVDDNTSRSPLIRGIGSVPGTRVLTIDISSADGLAAVEDFQADVLGALRQFRAMRAEIAPPLSPRGADPMIYPEPQGLDR